MKDLVHVLERRADLQCKVCLTDEVRVHIMGKLPRDVERTSRLNRLRESVILLPRHAKAESLGSCVRRHGYPPETLCQTAFLICRAVCRFYTCSMASSTLAESTDGAAARPIIIETARGIAQSDAQPVGPQSSGWWSGRWTARRA